MKKLTLTILFAAAGTAFAQAPTSGFTGLYAGVQVGSNLSQSSDDAGVTKKSTYPGFLLGYAAEKEGFLLGVEAFADYHNDSSTYKDGGFGIKVGKVFSNVLVYGRVGATGTWPSWRAQYGAGLETKIDRNVGVSAFVTRDKTTDNGINRENNSFVLGLNYYFR